MESIFSKDRNGLQKYVLNCPEFDLSIQKDTQFGNMKRIESLI
jgi:hypothetical protein